MERATRVKAVVFDKTGTLTLGKPAVVDAVALDSQVRFPNTPCIGGPSTFSKHVCPASHVVAIELNQGSTCAYVTALELH